MPTQLLVPQAYTYCRYTPATATSTSTLRIQINASGGAGKLAQALVLKDTIADTAWAYLQTLTPPELQFP